MQSTRNFDTLDGLRGIAALVVVAFHFSGTFNAGISSNANLAVDLFFMISGVIMAHRYETPLIQGLSLGTFFRKRMLRLYPLYMLGTLIGVALVLLALLTNKPFLDWTPEKLAAATVFSVAMLPTPGASSALLYPLNLPAWSLGYEMLINLVWAIMVTRLTTPVLVAIASVSAISLISLGFAGFDLNAGFLWGGLAVGLARVTFGFTIGLLLHRAYRLNTMPAVEVPSWAILASALTMLIVPAWLGASYWLAACLVGCPLLVWLGMNNEPVKTKRPYAWLALMSYPAYTLHVPILGWVKAALNHVGGLDVSTVGIIGAIFAAAAIAVIADRADHWFDRPIRSWLGDRIARVWPDSSFSRQSLPPLSR